jgi:hypothetical protein
MNSLKELVGDLPGSADIYWLLRDKQKPFQSHFRLEGLRKYLPGIINSAGSFAGTVTAGKKIFIFATLHYWIEQAAVIGLTLAGLGNQVTLGYLPYSDWEKSLSPFDKRRQDLYARDCLKPARSLIEVKSLLGLPQDIQLPVELRDAVNLVTDHDVQYTSQTETVEPSSQLYRLRLQRNMYAAQCGLDWLQSGKPDVLVVPNGTILEFGIFYRLASFLKIPVVTYEFNDHKEQIWLAQDDEIMHQNTDRLWQLRSKLPLTPTQRTRIGNLETARQGGRPFGKSDRLWQNVPSSGVDGIRVSLGLDDRPVALLATNVLGDSLTLGRNLFCPSMSDWIRRTIQFFAQHPEIQLVIRVHPGEQLTHGPSMLTVIQSALPALPDHIHVVRPEEKVNTYDIMQISSLGLVYTTTTGLEMALLGIPVIVAGETHYRNAGFCLAPGTWEEYIGMIGAVLADVPNRQLSSDQVEKAWNYAYRFFFEFPQPFPWRLMHFWDDYQEWPLERLFSDGGWELFGRTFNYLAGEPIEWKEVA